MADNVGYTPGTGATIAADDIGGVLHQRVKIGVGADGTAVDVSTANPMPVTAPGGIAVTGALTDAELRAAAVPVSGPLTDVELRAAAVPVSVPLAVSATILTLTTAATGTNWTAFGSSACDALDLTNSTSGAIEYRRGGAGNGMQVLSGASRLIVGISNANQIEVRRVDTSNTQVTVQAEALVA
jgi:hypothetical protein